MGTSSVKSMSPPDTATDGKGNSKHSVKDTEQCMVQKDDSYRNRPSSCPPVHHFYVSKDSHSRMFSPNIKSIDRIAKWYVDEGSEIKESAVETEATADSFKQTEKKKKKGKKKRFLKNKTKTIPEEFNASKTDTKACQADEKTTKTIPEEFNASKTDIKACQADEKTTKTIPEEFNASKTGTKACQADEKTSLRNVIDTMTNTLRNLEREWKAGYTITVRGDTSLETSCIDVEKQIPGEFLTSCKRIGECIQELRKKNCKLKAENDDYMNRLSVTAGAMLSDNNPNIANLNDSDRPMKISEKYSNLYDNEWSDLYSELFSEDKENEISIIYHLFSLLKVVYFCCLRKAALQEGHMFTMTNNTKEQINEMWKNKPGERDKFMSIRKRIAPSVIQFLQQTLNQDAVYKEELSKCDPALEDDFLNGLKANTSRKYFDKCIEVCWYMVLQVPPLHLETESLQGMKLNKDTHKEYTKSGTIIEFCVWPALYLTDERKNILCKGTVQPYKLPINHDT